MIPVRVPGWIIESPEGITVEKIEAERNTVRCRES